MESGHCGNLDIQLQQKKTTANTFSFQYFSYLMFYILRLDHRNFKKKIKKIFSEFINKTMERISKKFLKN